MGLIQFSNEICSINKSFLNVSCFCLEYDDFRYFTINQGIIQRPVFNYYFLMEKVTNTLETLHGLILFRPTTKRLLSTFS